MVLKHLVLAFLGFGLFIAVMSVSHLTCQAKPRVVCFDKQKMQGQWIRQLAQHKASIWQTSQLTQQFKVALEKTLKDYSEKEQVMIIECAPVLAGANEITEQIAEHIAEVMRTTS